jgi:hypothetical protein
MLRTLPTYWVAPTDRSDMAWSRSSRKDWLKVMMKGALVWELLQYSEPIPPWEDLIDEEDEECDKPY